jgi:hypothetical protein
VPDNAANAGTCNAIPLSASFGSGASTYVGRIPASFMDPTQRLIMDVSFAPCGSVVFTAPQLQMGLGHVPNPVPNPFAFPTFDAAGNVVTLGSFLDYRPLYNSVAQGPFNYNMTQDTWSPLGFAPLGGTGFVWNGTDDVGFYLTYSGATGGNSCHRTSTEPFRLYASGSYQASSSSGSGAAGLKMSLDTATGAACTGCGSLTLAITGNPNLGGSINTTLGNLGGGVAFIGAGFGPFCAAQFCNSCPIGHGWQSSNFGSTLTLNIPNNANIVGLQVGIQGAGLMSPGACAAPMVALSDTMVIQITR